MSKAIAVFPQDRYRFELYDNVKRLTRQQIQKEKGCYALVNLWLFSLADQPKYGVKYFDHQNGGVMLQGKWAYQKYNFPGICIDKTGHLTTGDTSSAVWDYTACAQAEYLNGVRQNTPFYPSNGLTYTGLTADGSFVALVVSKDQSMSGDEAVDEMLAVGCKDILRWDGSWSSQGCLGPDMDIQPSCKRLVRGYLLIYERETEKKEDPAMLTITQAIMTQNACYQNKRTITPKGVMVHSTATPGADARTMQRCWDKAKEYVSVHFILDDKEILQTLPENYRACHCGANANNTHIAFEICEPAEARLLPINWTPLHSGAVGMTTWAIERWQSELQRLGYYADTIDGFYGPNTVAATKVFQRTKRIGIDGACGQETLLTAQKDPRSLMLYSAQAMDKFFQKVYNEAVELTAYLCKKYGLNPATDVLCHSEGYAAGIASNHADVMHWFPQHGKTMAIFREDVSKAMTGAAQSTSLNDAVDKLVKAGIISAADYWKNGDYSTDNVKALLVKMAAAI